jgi:hypothetical protein
LREVGFGWLVWFEENWNILTAQFSLDLESESSNVSLSPSQDGSLLELSLP